MEENTYVDEALRTSIDQVMTSFVDICANCINIHREGRWKSFKRTAKRILLDEGSVRDELDNFKKLTQDQLNVQATLTLEVALETNQSVTFIQTSVTEIDSTTKGIKTDVSGLVEAEHKRGQNDARKKNLETIKEKLGQKDEDIANVIEARDNMWKNSVKESGKWLSEVEEYKQWLDRSSSTTPILALTGDPGTGKSFLVSAIAQDVKSRNSATKAERSVLGYYSFSIATKTDSDRNRPEMAIKSICTQMAEQDAVYARHVAAVCAESGKDKSYFKDATCRTLWTTLGIGAPAKNAMHYILLDSVSTLSADELQRLRDAIEQSAPIAEEDKASPLRILLSGEHSSFENYWLTLVSAKAIDITQFNTSDITAFIVEELKIADLFQGEDQDSLRRRKIVEERLLKRSNNCYATVQQDLGKIKAIVASSGTEEELNRVLQESSTDPEAVVRSELETLGTVLNPREIEEVNELLMWAIVGYNRFELDELAAALYLRFNSVSLQPLARKITGKYSKIFSLSYWGNCLYPRDYVEECVVAERVRPRTTADDPKITATITITNGDVKAVQRFFWDLTHHSSFANGFEFRPGSDISQETKRKLQIYRIDAHFEIMKRAFDYFTLSSTDEREKGKALAPYLMCYLPDHLKALYEAKGLDELPLPDKQYITSRIYDMFNEGDLIERNWDICERNIWHKSDEEMGIFWKWLDDPVAIAHLGARDRRWLAEIGQSKHPNRSLLIPVMTMIARNWLQATKWDLPKPFHWIDGFLTLGTKPDLPVGEDNEEGKTKEQPVEETKDDGEIYIWETDSFVEKVKKAERWAKQALNVSEADCTWCIRLGQTYQALEEKEAAMQQFKKAVEMLQSQDPVDKERLCGVLQALGDLEVETKNALAYYKQVSELSEGRADILYHLAKGYASSGEAEEAASIIQRAMTEQASDTDSPLLLSMLKKAVYDEDVGDLVALFAALRSSFKSSPGQWEVVQQMLEAAIDKARTEDKNEDVAILQFQLGYAMYYMRQEFPEDSAKAVDYWRACLKTVWAQAHYDDNKVLVFIEQESLTCLGKLRIEQAMQADSPNIQFNGHELRDAHDRGIIGTMVRGTLASLYALHGQRDIAREILRVDMVTAFNILIDDDIWNDWESFASIWEYLARTGDFENARKACMLFAGQRFDLEVLKALLVDETPPLEAATAHLVDFYEKQCQDDDYTASQRFNIVWSELGVLSMNAEPDSKDAATWTRVMDILRGFHQLKENSFMCMGCERHFDFEVGFNACKFCYDYAVCDDCLNDLRADKPRRVFSCNKLHDWIKLEPWNMQSYIRAWKRLVPVTAEDGSEQLISASKWLGNLCDEWGLDKKEWNFE
ncbi:tetratricopeptide repeat protein [Aspergillus undulatus]|uniref:tetratricopeptide repeat protein n=1 Tax=Aspergillus undulatus TaxID=1810928 RepID=UPI003CCE3CC4